MSIVNGLDSSSCTLVIPSGGEQGEVETGVTQKRRNSNGVVSRQPTKKSRWEDEETPLQDGDQQEGIVDWKRSHSSTPETALTRSIYLHQNPAPRPRLVQPPTHLDLTTPGGPANEHDLSFGSPIQASNDGTPDELVNPTIKTLTHTPPNEMVCS